MTDDNELQLPILPETKYIAINIQYRERTFPENNNNNKEQSHLTAIKLKLRYAINKARITIRSVQVIAPHRKKYCSLAHFKHGVAVDFNRPEQRITLS